MVDPLSDDIDTVGNTRNYRFSCVEVFCESGVLFIDCVRRPYPAYSLSGDGARNHTPFESFSEENE